MLGGYFDESHDERKSHFFTIAGWVANTWDWLEVDKRWDARLEEYELPYFHSADCESGIGPFAKFRDNPEDDQARLKPHEKEKLREIKTKFVDICLDEKITIAGIGAGVLIEDFNSLTAANEEANRLLQGDPYFICFQAVMMESALLLSGVNHAKATKDMLAFVFDRQREVSGKAEPMYYDFQDKNPDASEYMASLTYADKQQYRRLQAADMLAYETFRFFRNSVLEPDRKMNVAFSRISTNIHKIYKFDRQALEMIIDHQTSKKPIAEIVREKMGDETKPSLIFDLELRDSE